MEFYIDGQKVGNIEDIEIETETNIEPIDLSFNKKITLSLDSIESNIRLMSNEMRKWCKLMRWNGKIYI
jgi:sporulation protein YlmC with PRC-barrel domain